MKFATTSNFMSFNALLILVTCLLDRAMNLSELVKFIETIICFQEELLVVMLILDFFFLVSSKTL